MNYDDLKKDLEKVIKKIQREQEYALTNGVKLDDSKFNNRVYYTIMNYCITNITRMNLDMAVCCLGSEQNAQTNYANIMDLLAYINVEQGFDFQLDKKLMCMLLGISVETYQWLLVNAKSKDVFQDMEEFLISVKQTSAELGTRKLKAIENNLKTDSRFNGHDVTYVDNKAQASGGKVILNVSSVEDTRKSLNKFDFKAIPQDVSEN